MECCICGKSFDVHDIFSLFKGSTSDGYLCKACLKSFPIMYKLSGYDSYDIKRIISYAKEQENDFECTSRIGELYLDEMHGKIAISKRGKDYPKELNSVFSLKDVINLDISMTEPFIICRRVYCNVLMSVHFKDNLFNFQKILLHRVRCEYKWVSQNKIQCKPPREYTIIRTIVSEMLNKNLSELYKVLNELSKVRKAIEDEQQKSTIKYKASGTDIATAEAILMLNDDCTQADIKKHYRQLIKALHPDVFGADGEDYTKKLNWAYDVLLRK